MSFFSWKTALLFSAAIGAMPAPGGLPPADACFWSYTGLVSVEAPVGLVTDTYGELFVKLNGIRLGPDAIDRVVASKDPFTLPEETGVDVASLNRKLKEFKGMIEGKGWDLAPVNESLFDLLRDFAKGQRRSVETQGKVVRESELGYPIESVATGTPPDFHPDGRYLLMLQTTYDSKVGNTPSLTTVPVFDRQTRTRSVQTTTIGKLYSGKFLPSGDAAVFGDTGQAIHVVPFRDGKLDFDKAVQIGDKAARDQKQISALFAQPDGKVIYGHVMNDDFYRYDVGTKTRTPVKFRDYVGRMGASMLDWGMVPGTDRLAFLVSESGNVRLDVVTVQPDGTIVKFAEGPVWPGTAKDQLGDPRKVQFVAGGKKAVAASWSILTVADLGTREVKPLKLTRELDRSWEMIADFSVSANGTDVVVTIENRQTKTNRLEIVDLNTGIARPFAGDGNGAERVSVSPDGKWLFTSTQYGTEARIRNLQGQ